MNLKTRLKIAFGKFSETRLKVLESHISYKFRVVPTCGNLEEIERIFSEEINTSQIYRLDDMDYFDKVDEIMRKHGYTFNEFIGSYRERIYFKDRETQP